MHIGFLIPFPITMIQGRRWREPGGGRCFECAKRATKVYIRGDDTAYCADCIALDLASASPSDEVKREQKHPLPQPVENVYERLKGVFDDDFALRAVVAGPQPNSRLWDEWI
jgi:hypothetical protein